MTIDKDIDYINIIMDAVEDVMKEQSELECRKNVSETIRGLKEKYPQYSKYIDDMLINLVKNNNVDFFADIRLAKNTELYSEDL